MKTLLITIEYPPFRGGVANYYFNLSKYWPLAEKIDVLHDEKNELISKNCFWPWRKTISTLLKQMKLPGFDYLLVGQILPLGTAAYLTTWLKPFSYAIILHGLDFALATSSFRKRMMTKLILGRADKIICANSRVARMVSEFNNKLDYKTIVINPGIEPIIAQPAQQRIDELKAEYGLNGYTTFLSIGRLTLRKGVDSVIKALSGDDLVGQRIKYFVIGKGKEEGRLQSLASVSPFSSSINFLGELSESEKWAWLHACDVFIMPAREIGMDFEGFGIVYLEANLAGKAVIAGDSGGVRDAVENNENGILVNPDNIEEIRQAICNLAHDKNLCAKLGENGRQRAVKNFNWEKQAKEVCEAIKR